MLQVVKKALRINHDQLDEEIIDLIEAAKKTLIISGVDQLKIVETDPLIKRAIITYCKAQFESDKEKAEHYQLSFNSIRNHLTLSDDYREVIVSE